MTLDESIEVWAKKYAELYEKHGREEGGPETWCNDVMLDSVVEDRDVMAALFVALEAAFLKAVEGRRLRQLTATKVREA